MQYYQRALLDDQAGDDPKSRKARLQENIIAYRAQLKALSPRLSETGRTFFGRHSLRGGLLLACSFGDALDALQHRTDALDETYRRPRAEVKILTAGRDTVYTLRYTTLRRCSVDYPGETPETEALPIGDWRHDELTEAGDDYFRHEILFTSGATLLFEFRHFSYQTQSARFKDQGWIEENPDL